MQQNKNGLMINYAMHYGAILGVFWALKHLVAVGSAYIEPLIYLYYLLNAVTFVLLYIYYFKFRDSDPEIPKSAIECIMFIISLCFFASFFEAAMIYIHMQFIDPAYFSTKIEPIIKGMIASFHYPPEIEKKILPFFLNKMVFISIDFIGNIFFGGVMGTILALIIGNKKRNSI